MPLSAISLSSQRFQCSFLNWWKWQNLVLILEILATVRNCGVFFQDWKGALHKEYPKPERRTNKQCTSTGLIGPLKSICLVSDDDRAGGKHCTTWAVTACDFTSDFSPATSNGVYSSPSCRSAWLCLAHRRRWVQNKTSKLTTSVHADVVLSHKTIIFCIDSVCQPLLVCL